ncbi:uncharacterized protein VSU04_009461 isoform 1-T3 [Chlamydotis macqueenii]
MSGAGEQSTVALLRRRVPQKRLVRFTVVALSLAMKVRDGWKGAVAVCKYKVMPGELCAVDCPAWTPCYSAFSSAVLGSSGCGAAPGSHSLKGKGVAKPQAGAQSGWMKAATYHCGSVFRKT